MIPPPGKGVVELKLTSSARGDSQAVVKQMYSFGEEPPRFYESEEDKKKAAALKKKQEDLRKTLERKAKKGQKINPKLYDHPDLPEPAIEQHPGHWLIWSCYEVHANRKQEIDFSSMKVPHVTEEVLIFPKFFEALVQEDPVDQDKSTMDYYLALKCDENG